MRFLIAVTVAALASVASVASMDTAAPPVTSTGTLAEQSVALPDTSPKIPVTVHVTTTGSGDDVTLTIQLTARWMGFADAGAGDAGPPDDPIVEATLSGAGVDGAATLDRAIDMAPGAGALVLSAHGACAAEPGGCGVDFTFTLERIERVRSGLVSVTWTPVASVTSDTSETVKVTVKP